MCTYIWVPSNERGLAVVDSGFGRRRDPGAFVETEMKINPCLYEEPTEGRAR